MRSILVSQIGYRPEDPKRVLVRAEPSDDGADDPEVALLARCEDGSTYALPTARRWGTYAGSVYWVGAADDLTSEGTYYIEASGAERSTPFRVAPDIMLEETLLATSVTNLAERVRGKLGWQDCAFDGRGLESHAIVVLGLVDALEWLPQTRNAEFLSTLRHGVDYLRACQRPDGSFMNEYYIARGRTVWTLVGLATSALARAAVALSDGRALDAAKRGWEWLRASPPDEAQQRAELDTTRRVFGQYAPWQPPAQLRARDVLLLIRAATDLYRGTNDLLYSEAAREAARELRRAYQIPASDGERFGSFRTWPDGDLPQPAWEHAGWGYNCGAVLPDDVSGIISLVDLFPDSDEMPLWHAILSDFAYGALLPWRTATPFGQRPLVDLGDELRFFGPTWHGFNGTYGQTARIASELARVLGEPELERLALDQLQWIAGLNPGAPTDPTDPGGPWTGLSWISGIGARSFEAWSGIRGSIGNGFSSDAQFRLQHLDDVADHPAHRNEEDWLVHNGSWLSGLAAVSRTPTLKVRVTEQGHPLPSTVTLTAAEQSAVRTSNRRGVTIWPKLPRLARVTVRVDAEDGRVYQTTLSPVGGHNHLVAVEFTELLDAHIDGGNLVIESGVRGLVSVDIAIETPQGVEHDSIQVDDYTRVPLPATGALVARVSTRRFEIALPVPNSR